MSNDKPKKLNALAVEKAKYHAPASGKLLPNKLPHEDGLYLAILPSGTKTWRYDFRDPQTRKRQTITYGRYPELTLSDAVDEHTNARRMLAKGKNPATAKQQEKDRDKQIGDNSFRTVGEEWYAAKIKAGTKSGPLSDSWKSNTRRWLEQAYGAFGGRPLPDIEAANVLKLVKAEEEKGKAASAEYLRQVVAQVFDYGIRTLRAPKGFNPAAAIAGAVMVPPKKHRKKLERDAIRPFLLKVRESDQPEDVKLGLEILLHCFPRVTELTRTPWTEIQGDVWKIGADRMKKRREHWVPLSPQVQAMFARLRELSDGSKYVFPSRLSKDKPRHRRLFNEALYRLGFKDVFSPHGARATATSFLAESGYQREIVKAQLSHAIGNDTDAAYFQTQFLDRRREMLAHWSNWLESLQTANNVVPIGAAA